MKKIIFILLSLYCFEIQAQKKEANIFIADTNNVHRTDLVNLKYSEGNLIISPKKNCTSKTEIIIYKDEKVTLATFFEEDYLEKQDKFVKKYYRIAREQNNNTEKDFYYDTKPYEENKERQIELYYRPLIKAINVPKQDDKEIVEKIAEENFYVFIYFDDLLIEAKKVSTKNNKLTEVEPEYAGYFFKNYLDSFKRMETWSFVIKDNSLKMVKVPDSLYNSSNSIKIPELYNYSSISFDKKYFLGSEKLEDFNLNKKNIIEKYKLLGMHYFEMDADLIFDFIIYEVPQYFEEDEENRTDVLFYIKIHQSFNYFSQVDIPVEKDKNNIYEITINGILNKETKYHKYFQLATKNDLIMIEELAPMKISY